MWLAPAPLHRVGVTTRWKTYYSAAMFDDQAQRYLSDCGFQERKSHKAFCASTSRLLDAEEGHERPACSRLSATIQ